MSVIISGIKTYINQDENEAIKQAVNKLGILENAVENAYITKTSIDARKQSEIKFVRTVELHLIDKENEKILAEQSGDASIKYRQTFEMVLQKGSKHLEKPPIVVGFGPAGMFVGLLLARNGYNPIIIERGTDVDKRVDVVNKFWQSGVLNSETNVQFGEGGAGTFSDGKLTTRINDQRCEFILNEFVLHGAPNEILRKSKPHIGTDNLRTIVKSIREEIIKLGGQIRFEEKLLDINIENHKIKSIKTSKDEIETELVIMAIGHSARDTFEMLDKNGTVLEAKAFSVGVRIEHLQEDINEGLYGKLAGNKSLPIGEYQLSHRVGAKAVYTFCMCPGGVVVPSSSEENSVVTNGMSEFARNRLNGNSALAVSVDTSDFGNSWDSGIKFQRMLEHSAFKAGGSGYKAPAQTVDCFMSNKVGLNIKKITPSYEVGTAPCDFNTIFPNSISSMLKLGLTEFGKKIRCFSANDVVMTGVETRTSSPVRIMRDENFCAVNIEGLYPCGEGSGYAGGIMSAAVDGIKIAEQIIGNYSSIV